MFEQALCIGVFPLTKKTTEWIYVLEWDVESGHAKHRQIHGGSDLDWTEYESKILG